MNKSWLIAKHEYTRHVFRRRFLIVLVGLPLAILAYIGLIFFMVFSQYDRSPVGYVDYAGIVKDNTLPLEYDNSLSSSTFLPYPDENAARSALEKKEIQAYFVLPANYRETLDTRIVYLKKPDAGTLSHFQKVLRLNLLANQSQTVTQRIMSGSDSIIATEKQQKTKNYSGQLMLPFSITSLVLIIVSFCSGYLIKAMEDETENNIIEILATSASPFSVMAGKILGLLSIGLTQLLVWGSIPLSIAAFVTLSIPSYRELINWHSVALGLITTIPTLLLICTLLTTVAVAAGKSKEGQSFAVMLILPIYISLLSATHISANPSSLYAIFLTMFPITAATTLLIRMSFATVPLWQTIASIAILLLSTAGAFCLSAWVFRRSVLTDGKMIDWQKILPRPIRALKIIPHRHKERKGVA